MKARAQIFNGRGRLLFIKILFILLFLGVGLKLVKIQVIDSGYYSEIAQRQYEDRVELPAFRGSIFDRSGRTLVSNVKSLSFAADPRMMESNTIAEVSRRFASVFGGSAAGYAARLSPRSSNFVWLIRNVDPAVVKRIRPDQLPGLIVIDDARRVYHFGDLAGQVLGFTDVDARGISGIESEFDDHLHGTDGYEIRSRDGRGRVRPVVDYPRLDPVNGRNIVLTIDIDYQSIVEEALRKGVEDANAGSGLAVMLDPHTGEILAMANYPRLDPAGASHESQSLTRNRVVTDMFEPGSVFKIVTAAAALEDHVVRPEDKFYAENGKYTVRLQGGRTRTISDVHPFQMLSFREGVEQSSNIVLAKISDRIGAESLYRMARDFGFGTETGVELPGEVRGELKKPTQWSGTTLNSMAYGYEVGVTPLQIAAAYCAVANGGTLYKPTILKEVLGENGEVVGETRPQPVRRVISGETAATLKEFFVGVVERGTGKAAKMEGTTVAGKTGTARKVIDGKYGSGSFTATFAGFFPAENPRVVCVVMLDTRSNLYSGGAASAPIFRSIAERVMGLSDRFAGGAIAEESGTISLPDVTNLQTEEAVALLESEGFAADVPENGSFVAGQSPGPGTKLHPGATVVLKTSSPGNHAGEGVVQVPDVRNLSVRRAMSRLRFEGLRIAVTGSGLVVSQSPPPGQRVKAGTTIQVRCDAGTRLLTSLH